MCFRVLNTNFGSRRRDAAVIHRHPGGALTRAIPWPASCADVSNDAAAGSDNFSPNWIDLIPAPPSLRTGRSTGATLFRWFAQNPVTPACLPSAAIARDGIDCLNGFSGIWRTPGSPTAASVGTFDEQSTAA